jgi:hypothetical protein
MTKALRRNVARDDLSRQDRPARRTGKSAPAER